MSETSPFLDKIKARLQDNIAKKAQAEEQKKSMQDFMDQLDAIIYAHQGAIEQLTKVIEEDYPEKAQAPEAPQTPEPPVV